MYIHTYTQAHVHTHLPCKQASVQAADAHVTDDESTNRQAQFSRPSCSDREDLGRLLGEYLALLLDLHTQDPTTTTMQKANACMHMYRHVRTRAHMPIVGNCAYTTTHLQPCMRMTVC